MLCENGKIFAYEEFGIQDGSGSAYANIYFIDTAKDEYLPGSPIRVQAPENDSSLRRVRAEAAAKASPAIAHYSLNDHPGQLVALNPYSEVGPAADSVHAVGSCVPPLSLVTVLTSVSVAGRSLLLMVQVATSPAASVMRLLTTAAPPLRTQL